MIRYIFEMDLVKEMDITTEEGSVTAGLHIDGSGNSFDYLLLDLDVIAIDQDGYELEKYKLKDADHDVIATVKELCDAQDHLNAIRKRAATP